MPELPEVETVCQALRGPLAGRTITSTEVAWHRTVEPLDPAEFSGRIAGKQVLDVYRRAKFIVCRLSADTVWTTHLRMTGKLLYAHRGAEGPDEPDRHLRVSVLLDNADQLLFYDARKFGRMRLYSGEEWQEYSDSIGPEPLDPAFTPGAFFERLQRHNRQIKPLLLDQSFIAGIGNIYADEALYIARIHPRKLSSSISRRKARALHTALVETLVGAIEHQGTTIRDYRSATGSAGTNQARLLVYGAKPGTRCPRCGTPFQRLVVGQRGTTICPRCQRLR